MKRANCEEAATPSSYPSHNRRCLMTCTTLEQMMVASRLNTPGSLLMKFSGIVHFPIISRKHLP
jgi:hypothetical protein